MNDDKDNHKTNKKYIFYRYKLITTYIREVHGAMVRAWHSADVAACRAVSITLGAGFSEKYHISPLPILGHCQWCVLGQDTSPSNALLHSGENEYLVGQRWQCVR